MDKRTKVRILYTSTSENEPFVRGYYDVADDPIEITRKYAHLSFWRGDAPNLQRINEWANFNHWKGSAPELEVIGMWIMCESWTGVAPKLKSINKRNFKWGEFWERQ